MASGHVSEAVRRRAARRGSIVMVVIMLLLLLAILGAAYISTARNDRLGSIQYTNDNQIDAMTDGIAQIVKGIIVSDLNDYQGNLRGAAVYRGTYSASTVYCPGDVVDDGNSPMTFYSYVNATPGAGNTSGLADTSFWQAPAHYYPVTSSFTEPWLASRVPDQLPITGSGNPVWTNITQSLSASGTASSLINAQPFEDPTTGVQFAGYGTNQLIFNAEPGFTGAPVPGYPTGLPTLAIPSEYTTPGMAPGQTTSMVAADADGDGIADSLWARIPGAYDNGLTWYYAVRIVDNNAAINANTAWDNSVDFATTSFATYLPVWGCFPGDLGFNQLIINAGGADSLQGIISYRNGNPTPKVTAGTPPEYVDGGSGANYSPLASSSVYDEAGVYGSTVAFPKVARSDFKYITQKDAQMHELSRRLDNPGYNGANAPFSSALPPNYGRYQALPLADTAALAYDFILVNPNITAPSSLIETFLLSTLYYNKATTPYSTVAAWASNFNYNSSGFNCRPLIVTRNGASNYICPIYDPNYALSPMGNWETLDIYQNVAPPMLPYGPTLFSDHQNQFRGNWYPYYSAAPTSVPPLGGYALGDIVVRRVNVQPPTGAAGTLRDSDDWVDQITAGTPSGFGGTIPSNTAGFRMGPNYSFFCKGGAKNVVGTNTIYLSAGNDPAAMAGGVLSNAQYWQFQPYNRHPCKANVNTATFRELYRDFFSVFVGSASSPFLSPFGPVPSLNPYDNSANTATNPQLDLRSPIRDVSGNVGTTLVDRLDPPAVMMLRAAIAAVNTLGLRDQSQNVISRTIYVRANYKGADPCPLPLPTMTPAVAYATAAGNWAKTFNTSSEPFNTQIRVYSTACNPYIAMVHVNTNVCDNSAGNPYDGNNPAGNIISGNPMGQSGTVKNPLGYIAIYLYNPYSVPLTLTNWQLGTINNRVAATYTNAPSYPTLSLTQCTTDRFGNAIPLPTMTIPPHGTTILENYSSDSTAYQTFYQNTPSFVSTSDANFRPQTIQSNSSTFMGGGNGPAGAGDSACPNGNYWSHAPSPTSSTDLQEDVFVHNLSAAIGHELVLLRPRRMDGTYTASTLPTTDPDYYNEGTPTYIAGPPANAPNLYDLVPVDSFDLTGLPPAASGQPSYAWWFVRANNGNPNSNTGIQLFHIMQTRLGGGDNADSNGIMAATRGEYGGPYVGTRGTSGLLPRQYDPNGAVSNPNFLPVGAGPPPVATQCGPFPGTFAWQIGATQTGVVGSTPADPLPPNSCVPWDAMANNTSSVSSFIDGFPPMDLNAGPLDAYLGSGNSLGGMPGPNPVYTQNYTTATATKTQEYPFGGFARAGDMLDIPFAGSYRIMSTAQAGNQFVEMNALPMDLFFTSVDDLIPSDENCENLGRFCPMSARSASAGGSVPTVGNDYYWWSSRIFDYLTVNAPNDMYTPEFDPGMRDPATPVPAYGAYAYPSAYTAANAASGFFPGAYPTASAPVTYPTQVYAVDATATDETDQDTAPVEGLININTAPVPVLEMLPGMTLALAQAIVTYRDTNGPFMSLFDLNKVPNFQNYNQTFSNSPVAGTTPTCYSTSGLPWNLRIMPGGFDGSGPPAAIPNTAGFPSLNTYTLPANLPENFRNDFANLTMVSNLTTTRSDTFTVYIVVAGWSSAGAGNAIPRVLRRYAFLIDRSVINSDPDARTPKTYAVPAD